ncbi:DNA recombination protein RmuC [Patescibacteria group bacterium]
MSNDLYLIAALIIGTVAIAVFLINKRLSEISKKSGADENLLKIITDLQKLSPEFQKGLQSQSKNISDTLHKSTQTLNERLDKAARYMSQVSREVGQMSEIGRSMKDLQEFLKSPKLRGNIGEEVLKDLIGQMFPKKSIHLQYSFKSGEKVDAALKTDAGLLPIDSKFPMENFQRMAKAENKEERNRVRRTFVSDVKKHIRDISKKYILPEEGTMDFALMYVPSEAVYYEIANITDLTNFARQSRVYPVSPTTLYAHLQTILLSFEGKKIEARSREVFRMMRAIQKDYEKTDTLLSVLGRHLNNAYNQMNNVVSSFNLLGQKLSSTQALGKGKEEASPKLKESHPS